MTLPDIPAIPLFAKIPFTLRIVTETKEMKYDADDKHKEVFPEPPSTPENVTFLLRRKLQMTAKGQSREKWETLSHLGGLGEQSSELQGGKPITKGVSMTYDKWWIPSENDKHVGSWRQETTIDSSFTLKCSPSFSSSILQPEVLVSFVDILSVLTHR